MEDLIYRFMIVFLFLKKIEIIYKIFRYILKM